MKIRNRSKRGRNKAVLGLLTAVACLFAVASPAGASPGDITAGSFLVTSSNGLNTLEFTIPSSGTTCTNPLPDPTIDGDITTGNQVKVNTFSSKSWFETGGNIYELDLSLYSSTPGTYNNPNITGLEVILQGTIYEVSQDANGVCTKTTPAVCQGIYVPLLLHGTSDGGPAPDAPGDTITLSGGTNNSSLGEIVISGGCGATFSPYNGGSVEVPNPGPPTGAPLTFEFT